MKTADVTNQDYQDSTTLAASSIDSTTLNSLMLAQLQGCHQHFEQLSIQDHRNNLQIEDLLETNKILQSKLEDITRDYLKYSKQFQSLEDENKSLLTQLHQTQEAIEQYIPLESELEMDRHRLERILARYDNHWDYESISAHPLDSESGQQIVQWHLTDVKLGDDYKPDLVFRTVFSETEFGIVIQRENIRSAGPLVRWPGGISQAFELPLMLPLHGYGKKDSIFNTLGPSDWKALQSLVARLSILVGQNGDDELSRKIKNPGLREGLVAYGQALSNWPAVLRYDAIELCDTTRMGDYTSLEIRLINLQLGQHSWAELKYRLASVSTPDQVFGKNPRLEFPLEASQVFRTWFAESDDERGPRLELRFAHPSAMDTRVWNALNGHDQVLIAGLVASLRAQLTDLSQYSSIDTDTWRDWDTLAESIKSILSRQITAPSRKDQKLEMPEEHAGGSIKSSPR